MDVSYLLDALNDAQRQAVTAEPGSMLVLAGAGSGKTRVLTHRIAFLVKVLGISPLSIVAVTFTNKASREMRLRIEDMLGFSVAGMWMGTFHGLSHKFLRMHWQEAGLKQTFQIIDSDDQLRIVKRLIKDAGLDDAYWPAKQVQYYINGHKEEGRRSYHLGASFDEQQKQLNTLYADYEETCERLGVIDFTEILLRTVELLRNNEKIRQHYQEKFQHVLVDEFQDTNSIQYEWLQLLSGKHKRLMAVGDDDQSIYGWRGAKVENILQFEKDYENVQMVRLEQNYRSTKTILEAANAVIRNNDTRLGKELWTDGDDGELIKVYGAYNEQDEARFVISQIQDWVQQGNTRDSIAILYRSNAQSRVFEEKLIENGIPYRVYGGLRFFERQEIKDALAYMRLVNSKDDDSAFERVVNVPTRGIGAKTMDKIRSHSRATQQPLWQACISLMEAKALSAKVEHSLSKFMKMVADLHKDWHQVDAKEGKSTYTELTLAELTECVVEQSGLIDHYKKEKGERGEARIENLQELISATRGFDQESFVPIVAPNANQNGEAGEIDDESIEEMNPLTAFLANAALEAGEGQADEWEDCVQLMSLHSAKGLEFPLVFLTGLEEGLFPHQRSMDDASQLEEERRLCYVGMTRAMQQLYLTFAEIRRLYGKENYTTSSRFLSEVPEQYKQEVRQKQQSNFGSSYGASGHGGGYGGGNGQSGLGQGYEKSAEGGLSLGKQVRHEKFGDGVILNIEGQGEYTRLQVNFANEGMKWLMMSYVKLEVID